MSINYTPLDLKKLEIHHAKSVAKNAPVTSKPAKAPMSTVDILLVCIIGITLLVLGVLLFMLYQKSLV